MKVNLQPNEPAAFSPTKVPLERMELENIRAVRKFWREQMFL
jgi:hypothetical protein